ncbi:MAG TPA: precorrin-3B C(17)-methyltransferase, partial [Allocoleopsis sp.]
NLLSQNNFIFETEENANIKARIWISANERLQSNNIIPEVQWYPRILWVGIGCERDTDIEVITEGITETLRKYNLGEKAIAGLASIDIKADEKGLIEYCTMRNIPLITFPAEKLKLVSVPHPSKRVLEEVGTPSVAESAALMAAKTETLLVSKEIYKIEGKKGAITVAIAVAEREYIGKDGEIYLIGTGPGNLTQITPAAKSAIIAADVVIGYGLYIDLIETLLRPEQIIEKMPITQEKQRAERAIELAKWGLKVAVISSGDIGIYAMGGLVLEQLKLDNWDGQKPSIQILPGITALQSAASRLGTPIMHDFCAISLSDLLTPWAVIEKRLNAAASADFVVGLYNPKSQNRTEQIAIAQRIFLQYREEKTPVGIVKSAYREDEEIKITTLGEMLEYPIDMLTTIIIGNQSTMNYKNWLITPRGYNGL